MHSVSVNLEPAQFLAGWRAERRARSSCPSSPTPASATQVAVRVGIFGQTIRATVFGKVAGGAAGGAADAAARRASSSVDAASVPAVGFLAMAARGEPVSFQERAPRFARGAAARLRPRRREVEVSTINVSRGRLRAPLDGAAAGGGRGGHGGGARRPLQPRAPTRWSAGPTRGRADGRAAAPGRSRALGLRVVAEGRGGRAWRALVAEVARSGARAA